MGRALVEKMKSNKVRAGKKERWQTMKAHWSRQRENLRENGEWSPSERFQANPRRRRGDERGDKRTPAFIDPRKNDNATQKPAVPHTSRGTHMRQ